MQVTIKICATSPNKRGTRSGLVILWALGFRYARMALAPLNHIAPARESSSTRIRYKKWAGATSCTGDR